MHDNTVCMHVSTNYSYIMIRPRHHNLGEVYIHDRLHESVDFVIDVTRMYVCTCPEDYFKFLKRRRDDRDIFSSVVITR